MLRGLGNIIGNSMGHAEIQENSLVQQWKDANVLNVNVFFIFQKA